MTIGPVRLEFPNSKNALELFTLHDKDLIALKVRKNDQVGMEYMPAIDVDDEGLADVLLTECNAETVVSATEFQQLLDKNLIVWIKSDLSSIYHSAGLISTTATVYFYYVYKAGKKIPIAKQQLSHARKAPDADLAKVVGERVATLFDSPRGRGSLPGFVRSPVPASASKCVIL